LGEEKMNQLLESKAAGSSGGGNQEDYDKISIMNDQKHLTIY